MADAGRGKEPEASKTLLSHQISKRALLAPQAIIQSPNTPASLEGRTDPVHRRRHRPPGPDHPRPQSHRDIETFRKQRGLRRSAARMKRLTSTS